MKSVLISIQPKWCEKIANGQKTIEVRKTRPKINTPFKCHIYATKSNRYILDREPIGDSLYCWDNKSFNHPLRAENFEEQYNGRVIGEFVCDRIYEIRNLGSSFMIGKDIALTNRIARESCLEFPDLRAYLKDKNGYAWHISDLKIYDEPKELVEFSYPCPDKNFDTCYGCKYFYHDETEMCCKKQAVRPPQSWCYVDGL